VHWALLQSAGGSTGRHLRQESCRATLLRARDPVQPKGHLQSAKQWTMAQWHPALLDWAEGSSDPSLVPLPLPTTCMFLNSAGFSLMHSPCEHGSSQVPCVSLQCFHHRAGRVGESCLLKWHAADVCFAFRSSSITLATCLPQSS